MYSTSLQSRVLVHEHDPDALMAIKAFCEQQKLIGLVGKKSLGLLNFLKRHCDLGAIFISDHSACLNEELIDLCIEVHRLRQEVPIFLRTQQAGVTVEDLPLRARHIFAGIYQLETLPALAELVTQCIFNRQYPNNLVHGIQDISVTALSNFTEGINVSVESPYLVNDHLVHGELSSLIPLESTWCKGHMMMQLEQDDLLQLMEAGKICGSNYDPKNVDFREINNWLSEVTNLIWGPLRSNFLAIGGDQGRISDVQIPIINNQRECYVSFGTVTPQLVFKYILADRAGLLPEVIVYQKFIFNITWIPDMVAGETISPVDLAGDDVELF